MIKVIITLLVSSVFVGVKLYRKVERNKKMRSDSYIPFYSIGEVPEIDCIFRKTGVEGNRSLEFYKEEIVVVNKPKGVEVDVIMEELKRLREKMDTVLGMLTPEQEQEVERHLKLVKDE